MLLRQGAANVLRFLRARKRSGSTVSLNAMQQGEADRGVEYVDRERQERAELAGDVAASVASLPAELRPIAELLKEHPLVEVARRLGLSRSTIYGGSPTSGLPSSPGGSGAIWTNHGALRRWTG